MTLYRRKWLEMPFVEEGGFDHIRTPIALNEHEHDGFELTYASTGEATWIVDGGDALHLTGGSIAIIQPGIQHQGEWQVIRPCRLFWFVFRPGVRKACAGTLFTPALMREADALLAQNGNCVFRVDARLQTLFDLWLEVLTLWWNGDDTELTRCRARTLVCEIFLGVLQVLRSGAVAGEAGIAAAARRVIAANLDRTVSVSELAAELGLSTTRFTELFRRETGMTPADARNRMRCEKARELLLFDHYNVTDVAYELGFSSSQYFASVFKRYSGMTPSEFIQRES